jgi:hypothetical protein
MAKIAGFDNDIQVVHIGNLFRQITAHKESIVTRQHIDILGA